MMTMVVFLCIVFTLISLCSLTTGFDIIWNVPSQQCLKYSIDLVPLLRQYGISVNDGDKFQGEVMTIFYDSQLGLYPKILSNGTAINGGIPQMGDLDNHLKKAAADLQAIIPNTKFQGLGVIDWEAWRPVWEFNWDPMRIYQQKSKEFAKEMYPWWTDDSISKLAEMQWENSTKSWMLGTLHLARQMRPGGIWCYYLFPDCYNYQGNNPQEFQCSEAIRKGNDKLKWLWEASTAICPSLYVYESHLTKYSSKQRTWFTNGRIKEAQRLASPKASVYPYVNYSLKPGTMVPQEEFWRVMAQIASSGSEGAVIWGSSASVASKQLCLELKEYIVDVLGPASEKITWNAARCSKTVCNDRGRCTWPQDTSVISWKFLAEKNDHDFHPEDILCQCDDGFQGKFCEKL